MPRRPRCRKCRAGTKAGGRCKRFSSCHKGCLRCWQHTPGYNKAVGCRPPSSSSSEDEASENESKVSTRGPVENESKVVRTRSSSSEPSENESKVQTRSSTRGALREESKSSKCEASEDDEREEEEAPSSKREASEEAEEKLRARVRPKTFCQFYCDHPYDRPTIDRKMKQLYDRALTLLAPNFQGKDLNAMHLEQIFDWVDEYFFAGRLGALLEPSIGQLTFSIVRNYKKKAAGFTSNIGREISINLPIFNKIFTSPTQTHMFANGLKCNSRLHCMLLVFCHEVIHVIINNFCSPLPPYLAEAVATGNHHQMFRTLARNIFGHTSFTHMLSPHCAVTAETRDALADPADVIAAWHKDKKQLFEYHHPQGRKYWSRIVELDESHLRAELELLRGVDRDGTSFIPNRQLSKRVPLCMLNAM